MARVVRLKRSKGVVVQDCDVYIGRRMTMGGWNLPESKWKNPYTVKECGSNEAAVKKFEEYIRNKPELLADIEELRGKSLGKTSHIFLPSFLLPIYPKFRMLVQI